MTDDSVDGGRACAACGETVPAKRGWGLDDSLGRKSLIAGRFLLVHLWLRQTIATPTAAFLQMRGGRHGLGGCRVEHPRTFPCVIFASIRAACRRFAPSALYRLFSSLPPSALSSAGLGTEAAYYLVSTGSASLAVGLQAELQTDAVHGC